MLAFQPAQVYESNLPAEHPEIRYWQETPRDPVSRLANQLATGAIELEFDRDGPGYLASILERLGVSVDSQTLVYSKTSLQRRAISPRTPRAIYFSDDVAVGYVPDGAAIEMAGTDPRQGVMLYSLANIESPEPQFQRPRICLACHQAPATLGVPGIYVGSVLTSPSGRPRYRGSIVADHRTPFRERWGGWYVSAASSALEPHRGNAVIAHPANDDLTALVESFDAELYPGAGSDVVALMILEHQTLMTNLILRLGWEARIGVDPARLQARVDELVRYVVFADEPPLPGAIRGTSSFAATFSARGPTDSQGRSLRELDLETRLFRYPLSYMIHSDVFAALPPDVRATIYQRVHEQLEDNTAVLEILHRTRPESRPGAPPR